MAEFELNRRQFAISRRRQNCQGPNCRVNYGRRPATTHLLTTHSALPMGIVYFRRYRMEIDLAQPLPPEPPLPTGYRVTAWDDRLLDVHADTKYRCFHWEMDANVFPSLSTREGCRRLMTEISRRSGFVPEA